MSIRKIRFVYYEISFKLYIKFVEMLCIPTSPILPNMCSSYARAPLRLLKINIVRRYRYVLSDYGIRWITSRRGKLLYLQDLCFICKINSKRVTFHLSINANLQTFFFFRMIKTCKKIRHTLDISFNFS